MSIHVLCDHVPPYAVQPILPCYKGNNNDNFKHRLFKPGGRSANDSRPVNNYRGTDLNSADGGPETGTTVPRTSGSLSFPELAPTPLQLDEAGGAVTGAPGVGVGNNRDVWM